ncbi:MAG: anthranilate synthase component I [Calditrichaeota bacterium]|nr:MAG: anthranilate synthase component I [Calditrichota bacterium]
MNCLSFEEFKKILSENSGNIIPVYASFLADMLTPVSAFLRLQSVSNHAFLLESVEGGEKTARYSFLGCQPFCCVQYNGEIIEVEQNGKKETIRGNIFTYMRNILDGYCGVHIAGLPRFTGGAVGYFGYETVALLENIPKNHPHEAGLPEARFMFFDTILVFDHLTHEIYIIANVFLKDREDDLISKYDRAIEKIHKIKKILDAQLPVVPHPKTQIHAIHSNFSEVEFCTAVKKAKKYIEAGDIFQVVLSQAFQKTIEVDPFSVYRALRVINPSPYLYFLKMDDADIIGSSPELLVRVENGVVEVRPIAGTRPRGKNEEEDRELERELREDEKEIAEHVMLVDLGRNDVGRVCEYGSVEVTEFMVVEKYSHVMHLVSNVRGTLRADLKALDALQACFPAGTVSGAPKIRAMQIIHELEPSARGVYAGALGYLDFSGNLDTCIAIRTIVTRGNQAYFQAGAGIVADSVPEREYQETLNKASALKAAIEFAERGLE